MSISPSLLQTPCEALDNSLNPLCVLPCQDLRRQHLKHHWAAVLVTDKRRVLLGGEALDIPFQAPVPASAARKDTALNLMAPLRLNTQTLAPLRIYEAEDGRLINIFQITITGAALSARAGAPFEPINLADLPMLAARNMLGPVITALLKAGINL